MPRPYRTVTWKRNINKLPAEVRAKLDAAPEEAFVAGVVKAFTLADLQSGVLSHLGVQVANGALIFPTRVLPPDNMGRYSSKNVTGWEVIRRDLPKETFQLIFDAPNFGDWTKGSHTVIQNRERFPRDTIEPPTLEIVIENLSEAEGGNPILKFTVDMPLDRQSATYAADLLFALNLLQENLGCNDVIRRDAVTQELIATLSLDWEIFPVGTREEEVVRRMVGQMARPSAEVEAIIRERVAMFSRLRPRQYIQGRGGLNRYFGAQFADDLVVFENIAYGNALFVLYEDWATLTQRSRIDLLRQGGNGFTRFRHTDGWRQRFIDHMREEKRRRGIVDEIIAEPAVA
jgi:hypothetical protein